MSASLSVTQVLAGLEAQMELHRRREIHHAEQEIFHREQRALHLAELENVTRHYEAFRGIAGSAADIAARDSAGASGAARKEEEMPSPHTPALRSRLVARVVSERPAGQAFTPANLAAEINRRFGKVLKRPIDTRVTSAALRRMVANGQLRIVQRGKAHNQSQYAR